MEADLLQVLGAGGDAAMVAVAVIMVRLQTRIVKVETLLHVVCKRLGISADALKG